MAVFVLALMAVIIGLLIKSSIEADERKKEAQRAVEAIAAKKEKLRENEILKIATECIVEYILHAKENAMNVPLGNKEHHFFVADITKTSMSFNGGIIAGERPHVSPSEDFYYDVYSCWLSCLKLVHYTSYEVEGYSELDRHIMPMFLEVLSEELQKRGGSRWSESYCDSGCGYLLIWDLTKYHPQKELKAFL